MMRKVVLVCVLMLSGIGTAPAQSVPEQMAFTARLQQNGQPAAGALDLTFRLFPSQAGGAAVWTESHTGVMFTDGLGYVQLGETQPLDAGVLDGSALYLEIVVDGTTMNPRLAVGSVPYAVRAAVAGNAESLGPYMPSDFVTGVAVSPGLTGGGSSGDLTIGVNFAGSGTATTVSRSDHTHPYLPVGSSLMCTGSDKVTGITAAGDVMCSPDVDTDTDTDTDTTYTFGDGLVSVGTDVSVDFATAGGDAGSLDICARGDHIHDGRYFTESELSASGGTVNAASNPVDWSRLKGMPAGFADGLDQGVGVSGGAAGAIVSSVSVRARSDCGTIAPAPRMELYVNHSLVGGVDVTSATFGDFAFTLPAATYAHEVSVAFVNDNSAGGCDHNLYVESITFGATTLSSTATENVILDGGSSFFDGVGVAAGGASLASNGALRFFLGPSSDAPMWVKVHEAVLSNANDYVISGLDGNRDRAYMVVLSGYLASAGADRTVGLRPNGATTNYGGAAQHVIGHEPSVTYHNFTTNPTGNMLPLCRSHYASDGSTMCSGLVKAETGSARLIRAQDVFARNTTTTIMATTHINSWLDTTANITTMTLNFGGAGDFDGKLYVYRLR
jgi:hypothetical protein